MAGVQLDGADLSDAKLSDANFAGASLKSVSFKGAKGWSVDFEKACASGTLFSDSEFMFCYFDHADLSGAALDNAQLDCSRMQRADLTGADLRGTQNLLFDENPIRNMRQFGKPNDEWSRLRRAYTGPLFFVHAALLVLFIVPYGAKLLSLTAVGQMWAALEKKGLISADESIRQVPACEVLVGLHDAPWVPIIGATLLLYNLLRGYLTLQVGMLRDAQEHAGVSPALSDYRGSQGVFDEEKLTFIPGLIMALVRAPFAPRPGSFGQYLGLVRMHRLLRLLMWVAILSFSYHAVHWVLTTQVPLIEDKKQEVGGAQ